MDISSVFAISSENDFLEESLKVFRFQYSHNKVYREFCEYLKKSPKNVTSLGEIPFLPIQFFKTHKVYSSDTPSQITFSSSGTTGSVTSKHLVADLSVYKESFRKGFEYHYGSIKDYVILALLPSYLERKGSSLIYMVEDLIRESGSEDSGFYLHNLEELSQKLISLEDAGKKILLIGVSFALLDLVEDYKFQLKNTIVMETGGMKGRRKELIREELHSILKQGFGVNYIHSEYGMTELLSQGYSKGNGIFKTVPWLKILVRDTEDALTLFPYNKVGGINIIDLANVYSCSFIATQDLGRTYFNGTFEILGRFDNSDIRGCNLMIS